MKVNFKDFYGQNIELHNETASGNVRMEVRTLSDMNKVNLTKAKDCDVITDISLDSDQVDFLISTLQMMNRNKDKL